MITKNKITHVYGWSIVVHINNCAKVVMLSLSALVKATEQRSRVVSFKYECSVSE